MRLGTPLANRLRSSWLRRPLVWVRHFGLHANDVFVASHPKSGTTWLRFMLCQALTGRSVGFDSAGDLIPAVARHDVAPALLPDGGRLIQTHEPYRSAYKKAIYVVRDGRDVAVSYHKHMMRGGLWDRPFSGFLAAFLEGKVGAYGTWHDHVLSWLDGPLSEPDTLCVMKYEDMLADPRAELVRALEFLGADTHGSIVDAAVADNTADRMRSKESRAKKRLKAPKVGNTPFVRKAKAGQWQETFSAEEAARFAERAGEAMRRLGYVP